MRSLIAKSVDGSSIFRLIQKRQKTELWLKFHESLRQDTLCFLYPIYIQEKLTPKQDYIYTGYISIIFYHVLISCAYLRCPRGRLEIHQFWTNGESFFQSGLIPEASTLTIIMSAALLQHRLKLDELPLFLHIISPSQGKTPHSFPRSDAEGPMATIITSSSSQQKKKNRRTVDAEENDDGQKSKENRRLRKRQTTKDENRRRIGT